MTTPPRGLGSPPRTTELIPCQVPLFVSASKVAERLRLAADAQDVRRQCPVLAVHDHVLTYLHPWSAAKRVHRPLLVVFGHAIASQGADSAERYGRTGDQPQRRRGPDLRPFAPRPHSAVWRRDGVRSAVRAVGLRTLLATTVRSVGVLRRPTPTTAAVSAEQGTGARHLQPGSLGLP